MPYSIVGSEPPKPYVGEETFQHVMKDIEIETAAWKDWDGEWALVHAFKNMERIEVCMTHKRNERVIYHMDRFARQYYEFTCVEGQELFSGCSLTSSQHIQVWEKIMEHPRFRLLWICGEI